VKFAEEYPGAEVVHGVYGALPVRPMRPMGRKLAHAWVEWRGLAQDWQRDVMKLPPLPVVRLLERGGG
jgi:hypothetical protein